jgi:hypothetical protein
MSNGITLGQAKFNRAMAGSKPSEIVFTGIKKEKKMGWLKRKFAKWSREAWENSRDEDKTYPVDTIRAHDGINGKSSVRFTVYPASGGFVIESYKQDRYKENDGPVLTIVNHGEDLGKAVEHIIAVEALRS